MDNSPDYRRAVQDALKVRCVHLKTKRAYLGLPELDEVDDDCDTAVWWCEQTCEPLGPDGSSADPGPCERPGRPCYEPPLRP
jgi:hypothetical protein